MNNYNKNKNKKLLILIINLKDIITKTTINYKWKKYVLR